MSKQSRRLKRYLGFKRSAGTSLQGGIEHLLPGRISGWVFEAGASLNEVRLLVGAHLIARAEINLSRPDVCTHLGIEANPGFSIALPAELPPMDLNQPARLIALNADGSRHAEVQLLGKSGTQTALELKQLLNSDAFGLEGHCDGLVNGQLQGWAARRKQSEPAQIWLQSQGLSAIPIRCEHWRDGMSALGVPDRCGFILDLKHLPDNWTQKSIWCSFDKAGMYRLPQENEIVVPADSNRLETAITTTLDYSYKIEGSSTELQSHWQALEEFRVFLDGLEQELNRREVIRQKQSIQTTAVKGLLGRLFGSQH